ncbi:hypothetical protein ACFQWC_20305 [Rossellomorea sp. GCM10028870]|uniref:hypothetical protein n=1 Tax=Rossellomorea sp. GCM10028870 TaxID=3273426 RepID=UPI00361A7F49
MIVFAFLESDFCIFLCGWGWGWCLRVNDNGYCRPQFGTSLLESGTTTTKMVYISEDNQQKVKVFKANVPTWQVIFKKRNLRWIKTKVLFSKYLSFALQAPFPS